MFKVNPLFNHFSIQILNVVADVFKKHGVERFDPLNEQFDPHTHMVVFQVQDATKQPDSVAVVLKSGYTLQEIVEPVSQTQEEPEKIVSQKQVEPEKTAQIKESDTELEASHMTMMDYILSLDKNLRKEYPLAYLLEDQYALKIDFLTTQRRPL